MCIRSTFQMYLGQPETSPRLDNVHRFMAGVYLSTGFISFWAAATIRRQGTLVFLLALGVFMAGTGELVSISQVGLPEPAAVWLGLPHSGIAQCRWSSLWRSLPRKRECVGRRPQRPADFTRLAIHRRRHHVDQHRRLHRVPPVASSGGSIGRSSMPMPWPSGFRRTDSPARFTTWTPKSAAATDVVHNFTTGTSHSFGGEYLELVPHERIRYTDKFDDPNLPGEMQTTVTLKKVSCGTELNIVQEGIPDVIPAEACYLGWQESLTLLGKLVEAEIPD